MRSFFQINILNYIKNKKKNNFINYNIHSNIDIEVSSFEMFIIIYNILLNFTYTIKHK